MHSQAFDPETVLAHDRYIRALARRLVLDAHAAEDLAQQTWVASLTSRPKGRSLGPWLAATARNLAAKMRLSEVRRRGRERLNARAEAVPSHAELRERLAAHNLVWEAVLALEEPYRSTIVLRFLEGLPPRAVGRRMGVPTETVRTRVRRGLEQLRRQLDAAHGGDRAAWCGALLPLAAGQGGLSLATLLTGAAVVTTKIKLIAVALSCIALLLVLWKAASGPATSVPAEPAAKAPGAAPAQADAHGTATTREAIAPVLPGSAGAPATGSLLVHVEWADGSPAEGIGVRVVPAGDEPACDECLARSAAGGTARFAGLAPGPAVVWLDRGSSDRAAIVGGRQAEVTLRVRSPARLVRVEGRVVALDRVPVAGAEVLLSTEMALVPRAVVATTTADDGTFALRDVPAMCSVEARARGHAPSARYGLHAANADLVRVEVVLRGPGGSVAGLVRAPSGEPIAGAAIEVGDYQRRSHKLEDGTWGTIATPQRARSDAEGRFLCEGVAAGRVPVVARAKGYAVFTGDVEVAHGRESSIAIDLVPGVVVHGVVGDAEGKPVQDACVQVGDVFHFRATRCWTQADGSYRLVGLAPGDVEIAAGEQQSGTAKATLHASPGATLRWDPRLARGTELRGRVVDERGMPVAGAAIEALTGGVRPRARSATTDAQGRFAVPGLENDLPVQLDVKPRASGDYPCVRVTGVVPGPGETLITVRDADLPSAYLLGVVLAADATVPAEITVSPRNAAFQFATNHRPDPKSGAFKIGPLPRGTWWIQVQARGWAPLHTRPSPLEANESQDLGTLRLERPGLLEVTARRSDGLPLRDISWPIRNAAGADAGWVTLEGGKARADALAPGSYAIQALGAGVAHALHEFTIRSGATTKLDVTLQPAAAQDLAFVVPASDQSTRLWLLVTDSAGKALNERWVWRSDQTGRFEASVGLLPGTYRARARTEQGAAGTLEFTVRDGIAPQPLEWTLR